MTKVLQRQRCPKRQHRDSMPRGTSNVSREKTLPKSTTYPWGTVLIVKACSERHGIHRGNVLT